MEETSDFVELKLPAKPEYVGVVRLTISGIANRLGYSYEDIEDIKVAVAEACTNVVKHAYDEDAENPQMRITSVIYNDRLEISVIDQGGNIDIEEFNEERGPIYPNEPINQLKEGGLGLYLIETLMDKVEVKINTGVELIMTKFLRRIEVEQGDDSIAKEISNE